MSNMTDNVHNYSFNTLERNILFLGLALLVKKDSNPDRKAIAFDCLREMGVRDPETIVTLLELEKQFA